MGLRDELLLLFAGALFGFVAGALISIVIGDGYWHGELVRRGHAEYSRETGEWQWIENKE